MNDNESNVQRLTAILVKIVDREAKRRNMTALEVCGALGAVAGAVVGCNAPPEADAIMMGGLALGFEDIVGPARAAHRG